MHHLVQDEFQAKHLARGGHLVGPEGLKKGRSQSQIDYFSDGSEGRYIVTRRRSKVSIILIFHTLLDAKVCLSYVRITRILQ